MDHEVYLILKAHEEKIEYVYDVLVEKGLIKQDEKEETQPISNR